MDLCVPLVALPGAGVAGSLLLAVVTIGVAVSVAVVTLFSIKWFGSRSPATLFYDVD